ncbi:hypothetical protein H5410_000940 [Solanum commersonii]|uniref:DUF1985 domain-containing protein n=1 Tax=Solanum commersonii TaxID=4109 RepID=A0A9J6AYP7_SOLCO|nr:hypothetical protein H5410_000940 [Solanum commersonii]
MLQYKRKRTGTSSSNPNAKKNAESLIATRKRGTTTFQSIGGQPYGEEKSDQSSDDQSSDMEKNSKNNGLSVKKKVMKIATKIQVKRKKMVRVMEMNQVERNKVKKVKVNNRMKKKKKTHLSVSGSYDSRINVRVGFGAQFVEFRKILIAQKIENDFKKSCFGHFLKLDQSVAVQLPMKLVHGLCLRRIFSEKKKEVWIDYNGLPLCFGINEFAIMTELRCHSLPPLNQQLAKIGKEGEILVDLVGQSANAVVLIEKMSDPCLTKKQKLAISMVWFLHCVLCSKSAEKKIETHWLKMASKKNVFNSYPWGRVSFDLTINYLLKELDSIKSQYNLYGCPYVTAWALEAIPLQRLAKDSSPEKSIPRMIKWMAGTPAYKTNIDPIYQTKEQMQNQVVHPFLFPTNIEKEQIYVQVIESYEDNSDKKIDALKEELALVTAIKLNITVVEEGLEITGGENSVAGNYGVERNGDGQIALDTCRSFGGVGRDESYLVDLDRGEDTPSVIKITNVNAFNIDCCCKCETCYDKYETLLNKRTIYPSYARKFPYTPALKRRLAMNSKAKNAMKSRLEVNLYKPLDVEKREIFSVFISKKEEERIMYLNGRFNYQDLVSMTDPYFLFECKHVDEILSLMRKRQIWYLKHYDQTDLILDLNFCNTLYDQYNNLREKSLVDGAPPMHEALTSFEMDGDILKYCKGEMPYPYGRKWNGAKRIYTVMNINNTHFIALEFLMEKGLIQVYDCNIHMCDETFLTLIHPFSIVAQTTQAELIFNHLSKFFE